MSAANASKEEDHYFSSNPPPKALPQHEALVREFVAQHAAAGRRVVLVTSGGTTVPLERNTVRFIDNFSAGTRGATSAEYFLESGYGVIFLHRQFSLQPYSRHYSHAIDCFLDFMQESGSDSSSSSPSVVVNATHQEKMLAVLRKYRAARRENLLLTIPFVTITDYLHELRALARLMEPLGPRGLLYLAAAVSDFFVPPERLAEHKIQSTDATAGFQGAAELVNDAVPREEQGGPDQKRQKPNSASGPSKEIEVDGEVVDEAEDEETFDNFDSSPSVPRSKRLIVDLDPVPKFLKNLVDGWAPRQMIVSFKLETDPAILVHKARYSLDRYQHHLVVGNLLTTRKWEVVFVSPGRRDRWVRVPSAAKRGREISRGQEGGNPEHGQQDGGQGEHGIAALVGKSSDIARAVAGAGNQETRVGREEKDDYDEEKEEEEEVAEDKPLDPASLPEGEPEVEIESLIIPAIERLHDEHVRLDEQRS